MRSRHAPAHTRTPTRTPALILTLLILVGCGTTDPARTDLPAESRDPDTNEVTFTATPEQAAYARSSDPIAADSATLMVNGLSCPLCASNIDEQLARVPGVESVRVDLSNGRVQIALRDPRPSPRALADAVENSGFTLVRIEAGPAR